MHHVAKSLAVKRLYDSVRLFQDTFCILFSNLYSHRVRITDVFIKQAVNAAFEYINTEQENILPSAAKFLVDIFYARKLSTNDRQSLNKYVHGTF